MIISKMKGGMTMPYQGFEDGLYLAKQKSQIKPDLIDHYGVIDIGNILNHPQGQPDMPMVIHQVLPSIRIDWLVNTGTWQIMGEVKDSELANAIARIQKAIENPNYDLFGNNCEHFARYVTTGKKESKQLQTAVGIGLTLAAIVVLVWKIR